MNSKDIILNETEEPIGQQVLNITDLFINKTKKEYETKNLDIEKCNFDYYKKYTKKSNIFFFSLKNSDEYESNTGFKNLIFPQKNLLLHYSSLFFLFVHLLFQFYLIAQVLPYLNLSFH